MWYIRSAFKLQAKLEVLTPYGTNYIEALPNGVRGKFC